MRPAPRTDASPAWCDRSTGEEQRGLVAAAHHVECARERGDVIPARGGTRHNGRSDPRRRVAPAARPGSSATRRRTPRRASGRARPHEHGPGPVDATPRRPARPMAARSGSARRRHRAGHRRPRTGITARTTTPCATGTTSAAWRSPAALRTGRSSGLTASPAARPVAMSPAASGVASAPPGLEARTSTGNAVRPKRAGLERDLADRHRPVRTDRSNHQRQGAGHRAGVLELDDHRRATAIGRGALDRIRTVAHVAALDAQARLAPPEYRPPATAGRSPPGAGRTSGPRRQPSSRRVGADALGDTAPRASTTASAAPSRMPRRVHDDQAPSADPVVASGAGCRSPASAKATFTAPLLPGRARARYPVGASRGRPRRRCAPRGRPRTPPRRWASRRRALRPSRPPPSTS